MKTICNKDLEDLVRDRFAGTTISPADQRVIAALSAAVIGNWVKEIKDSGHTGDVYIQQELVNRFEERGAIVSAVIRNCIFGLRGL